MKRFIWKVWLQLNPLTKEKINNYYAKVSITGNTVKNKDIAKRIVESGSELKYGTILSILNQSNRIIRESLQSGNNVQTGFCHITPRVHGKWFGTFTRFSPERHKLALDISPTIEMQEALKVVSIEVLGVKDSGAYIGLVEDIATGKTDGTITANDDIIIKGNKLKIEPEEDAGLGVFFVNKEGVEFPLGRRLVHNASSKIIIRVPKLAAGEYTLKIVTRFNGSYIHSLKSPRTIVYENNLIIQ
jgi:hypothetical protein